MGSDVIRPGVRDVRAYEPGPSGTAVAGLIIALIALAIALYAAFSPRQMVNEGSPAVVAPLQKAAGGHPQAAPQGLTAPQGQKTLTPDEIRNIAASEAKQQIAALKQELSRLGGEIRSAAKAAPPPAQHTPGKPGGGQ